MQPWLRKLDRPMDDEYESFLIDGLFEATEAIVRTSIREANYIGYAEGYQAGQEEGCRTALFLIVPELKGPQPQDLIDVFNYLLYRNKLTWKDIGVPCPEPASISTDDLTLTEDKIVQREHEATTASPDLKRGAQ